MPYSRYGSVDPTGQYQGDAFNPMTGRLNGGQLVMQFLQRLQAEKDRKKQEGWDVEDREWKSTLQGLQKQKYEQDIAQGDREAKDYQKPVSPAAQFVMDRLGAVAAEQRKIREINAQAKATKEVNSAKPPKSESDKLYEWQDLIARNADTLEKELGRLSQEMLVYTKQIADNPGDPEIEAGLRKYIDANKREQNKVKQIKSRLDRVKVGQDIPADIAKSIDEYNNPPAEQPAPIPKIDLLNSPFGPKVGQFSGGAPAKTNKRPLAPAGSLPAGAKFTGQYDAEGYPLYKFKDGSTKRWKG